jgi:PleD family two-component response regulator
VTISLGVATGQDGEEHSPTTLLATAERRLHRAKKQGKNREVGS